MCTVSIAINTGRVAKILLKDRWHVAIYCINGISLRYVNCNVCSVRGYHDDAYYWTRGVWHVPCAMQQLVCDWLVRLGMISVRVVSPKENKSLAILWYRL